MGAEHALIVGVDGVGALNDAEVPLPTRAEARPPRRSTRWRQQSKPCLPYLHRPLHQHGKACHRSAQSGGLSIATTRGHHKSGGGRRLGAVAEIIDVVRRRAVGALLCRVSAPADRN